MAGVKVTDLPSLASADPADIFYVVDDSSGQSKKIDLATIITALGTALPYIHLRGTAFTGIGQVTGDIEVDVSSGGLMTLRFANGDIIGLGVDYGGYSALSFFDATINETCYLYLRGGDLFIENVDTAQGTGALISQINNLQTSKLNFNDGINVAGQSATLDGNKFIKALTTNKIFYENALEASLRGYSKLPSYYFIDSCSYLQSGTNAPTEQVVFETQVGDGIVTKTITYVAVGHYHITYDVGLITAYLPNSTAKVKVVTSNSNNGNTIINTLVGNPTASTIEISVYTRNAQTGNLTNGLLANSVIDVMWYV